MSKTKLLISLVGLTAIVLLVLGCGEGAPYVGSIWDEFLVSIDRLPLRMVCQHSVDSGLAQVCAAGLP